MSTKAKSLKSKQNSGSVTIVGEGRDELENRYFKFSVRGATTKLSRSLPNR